MQFARPLLIALSTYSALPLPKADFRKEDMKYVMCFFPLVGVMVGAVFCLWAWLADYLRIGSLLKSAGLVLIPLLVTGGIHMDGFLDVCDALSSWQCREKKLEILKDVHVGAFAVIRAMLYLLAMLGLYSESDGLLLPLAFGFVLSRCLAAVMINLLPNARSSGMLSQFQAGQNRRAVLCAAAAFGVAALTILLILTPVKGLIAILALAAVSCWFYRMSMRQFGGITGDLAGCFLQWCELSFAFALVILGRTL